MCNNVLRNEVVFVCMKLNVCMHTIPLWLFKWSNQTCLCALILRYSRKQFTILSITDNSSCDNLRTNTYFTKIYKVNLVIFTDMRILFQNRRLTYYSLKTQNQNLCYHKKLYAFNFAPCRISLSSSPLPLMTIWIRSNAHGCRINWLIVKTSP